MHRKVLENYDTAFKWCNIKKEFMQWKSGCYTMIHGRCHFINPGTVKVVL